MDLEALRQRVEQARSNPVPRDRAAEELAQAQAAARIDGFVDGGVVVTPDGVIRRSDRVRQSDGAVSRVTNQIFAAPGVGLEGLAARTLPKGHRYLPHEGSRGWVYDVTARGQRFTFFLHHDAYSRGFEVRLICPAVEKLQLVHELHIFPDGRLCLTPSGASIKDLGVAYARSVLWADGVAQMLAGHAWPWGE